ncbi:MAG: hypothetical protein HY303_09285, partial [Candidatus Wallbacteria bacterium]|nr:hypothetical protein [Candidatus Wallbacteria bacterium]
MDWPIVPLTNLFLRWWVEKGVTLGYDALVPIPWTGKPWKGPLQIVAAAVSRYRRHFPGVDLVGHAVIRKGKAQMKTLGWRDRFEAAKEEYDTSAQISLVKGRSVLLVDDVHTTGASTCTVAKILLDHGARSVGAFAIAKNLHEESRVAHTDPPTCAIFRPAVKS